MCKKIERVCLIFVLGFTMAVTAALASESSPPTVEELLKQLKILRTEISQIKQIASEAREIAVASRMESAKFKEEALYRLGIWRGKLGEGLMMSISAEDSAKKAEKMTKVMSERVELVWGRVTKAEERIDLLSSRLREGVQITKELRKRMDILGGKVEGLKTDVSLAKEMAATAKMEAAQARKETREVAEEVRRTKELFLSKVEDILRMVREWEKRVKPKVIKIKPPQKRVYYQVKEGESLWLIAKKVYNDPSAWRKIFEANRDKITSPELIYPGLRLIIPQE
jgi:outer membrane murein-binding lipoprotein Lpp